MPAADSQSPIARGALQAIFAVFLGLMVTAVVGVGVYTFYPDPGEDVRGQVEELWEQEADIQCNGADCILTAEERAERTEIRAQIRELEDKADTQQGHWIQRTSIVLVTIATALMATSLLLGEGVAILSNGILLGGLFTMLYGVGWGLASGSSVTRFIVLLIALAISIVLGYVKFARGRGSGASAEGPDPRWTSTAGSSDPALAERVSDLERRLAAVAQSLSAPAPPPRPDSTSDPDDPDSASSPTAE